jgi:hypothetical protein
LSYITFVQVCKMTPEVASTGSGIEKIQDKIARNLSSLKQMEERTFAVRQEESINDMSASIMKQMTEYLGEVPPDLEELLSANTKLSHMTEQLRMGTSHVLSGVSDSLERLKIPSDAQEAFIWMEFKEFLVDVDNEVDAKFAFPMATETANEPVCGHCRASRRPSREFCGNGDELLQCTSKHKSRFTWTCPNHFHLSCRTDAISHLKQHKSHIQRLQDLAVEKTTMFCCLDCLTNAGSKKKKKFRAVKLFRAAHVEFPRDLKFCEFYASIPPGKSDYVLTCVKPGVFPFLRFGGHHSKVINSADWHYINYWTYCDPTFSSAIALVQQDRPNGVMWTFSGEIQPLRCARVGVLTSDTLRKCGIKDSSLAAVGATELMTKMRHFHLNCEPAPEKKWEISCAKKLEYLTMALATDNGDIVVASVVAPLSGLQPDTFVATRTLTVQRDDAQRCAAERVAWNCDGTVLAASCQDHRIVTWEKARDIEAHPVDSVARRNAKRGTCEWICDGPIVGLCWSPVNAHQFLVATARSCCIMRFESGSSTSPAVIAVGSVYGASSDITCAAFGASGRYIAVGTQSSGWFAIDSSDSQHLSSCNYNFPLGGIIAPVLAICGLHVVKSAALHGDAVVDGQDFAVASRVASGSILHIWKYSEFKCKYQVIKEIHLPSIGGLSSIVTSLLCSRDSEKDSDSFKILALNGSTTGYLINYVGSCCYDSYVKPVEFWCPVNEKPVNVSRAAWGHMARTIAFCDFSGTKSKEGSGYWFGLPRFYELWRARTNAQDCISNPLKANHRNAFDQASTCDLSVHSVVRDDAGQDGAGPQLFEKVWNHDVVLHQQLVNHVAQFWKEFAKSRNISGEVAERVVQQIVVQKFTII